jgi:hypothetical protein
MPSGKKLLAHYDEEEREKQAREKRKMVLTGPGERVEDGTEGGTEGGGEGGKEEPRKAISLGQERARTALADYLTPAEMEKFKKPKKMRKKSGRKKVGQAGKRGRGEASPAGVEGAAAEGPLRLV